MNGQPHRSAAVPDNQELRDMNRCDACGKTRVVLDLAPLRPEHVSPQTHCACPDGPVADVDNYLVVFRRIGNRARIYVRPVNGADEMLVQRIVKHSERGLDFGNRSNGAYDAAINILRLVTTDADALRLYHEFRLRMITPLARAGGQLRLGDIRAWVIARTERLDLGEYLRTFLDGAVGDGGPYETYGDALAALAADVERRVGYPLSEQQRTQLDLAAVMEWNRRLEVAHEAAD